MSKDTWESLAEMGHSPKMIEAMLDEQEVKLNKYIGAWCNIEWKDELKKERVYIHFGDSSDFDEDEDHVFFFCEDEEELKNLDQEDFKILNYKLVEEK
jgi:hypothetical protein|tara:strand:- start:223 stop:516 length:294 start_codon:yes stop_codon:yes gene_type:complete